MRFGQVVTAVSRIGPGELGCNVDGYKESFAIGV